MATLIITASLLLSAAFIAWMVRDLYVGHCDLPDEDAALLKEIETWRAGE